MPPILPMNPEFATTPPITKEDMIFLKNKIVSLFHKVVNYVK